LVAAAYTRPVSSGHIEEMNVDSLAGCHTIRLLAAVINRTTGSFTLTAAGVIIGSGRPRTIDNNRPRKEGLDYGCRLFVPARHEIDPALLLA
jgi:hypothetical protein